VTALTLMVAGAEAGGLLPLAKRQGLLVIAQEAGPQRSGICGQLKGSPAFWDGGGTAF
jgi:hypothetical protein